MNSYLLTWNPNRWEWLELPNLVYRVNTGLPYDRYWSCGNTKRINPGDRFFLIRLGVKPKGILGCGQILSKPYKLPHWDEDKAVAGEYALRVDIHFEMLSEHPLVGKNDLAKHFGGMDWYPMSSGTSVQDIYAEPLYEYLIKKDKLDSKVLTIEEIEKIVEGKPKKVTITTYDRSSYARELCIEKHGTTCSICNFNFFEKYGEIGKGFIHVHHLKEISNYSDEHKIDPVKDLRPVCANCHAMLHKKRPAYSIEEMKSFIS